MKIFFSYAMAAVYIFAGIYLLAAGWFMLNALQNKGLGTIMILYGIFRAYRIFRSKTDAKPQDDPSGSADEIIS